MGTMTAHKISVGTMTSRGFEAKCPHCGAEIVVLLPAGLDATREAMSMGEPWPRVCVACEGSFAIQLASD